MLKAVILYNHINENHMNLLKEFLSCEMYHIAFTAVDMSSARMLHEKYYEIIKAEPDFLLTFDLAGMELRTEMDTATLNKIPVRMGHLLLENMESYRRRLGERFNFSMFFYGTEMLRKDIMKEFPDVPNVRALQFYAGLNEEGIKEFVHSFLYDFLIEAELMTTEQDLFTGRALKRTDRSRT